ncbi:uncharacterized protein [Ptychodera flava]|uniref:uncharacterized protein n=1 Tax=Ptychodera flava TaxID=63121 RepID=UPI00396A665E
MAAKDKVKLLWSSPKLDRGLLLGHIGPYIISVETLQSLQPGRCLEDNAMDAYLFLQENGEYSKTLVLPHHLGTDILTRGKKDIKRKQQWKERFLGADNIISVIYEPGHWSVMCADMVAGMFYHIDSMKIRDSKQEMENWSNFLSNLGITKEWKVATVNNDFQQDSTSCGVYAVKISARNNAASVEMVYQRCSVSIVNGNFTASATV